MTARHVPFTNTFTSCLLTYCRQTRAGLRHRVCHFAKSINPYIAAVSRYGCLKTHMASANSVSNRRASRIPMTCLDVPSAYLGNRLCLCMCTRENHSFIPPEHVTGAHGHVMDMCGTCVPCLSPCRLQYASTSDTCPDCACPGENEPPLPIYISFKKWSRICPVSGFEPYALECALHLNHAPFLLN